MELWPAQRGARWCQVWVSGNAGKKMAQAQHSGPNTHQRVWSCGRLYPLGVICYSVIGQGSVSLPSTWVPLQDKRLQPIGSQELASVPSTCCICHFLLLAKNCFMALAQAISLCNTLAQTLTSEFYPVDWALLPSSTRSTPLLARELSPLPSTWEPLRNKRSQSIGCQELSSVLSTCCICHFLLLAENCVSYLQLDRIGGYSMSFCCDKVWLEFTLQMSACWFSHFLMYFHWRTDDFGMIAWPWPDCCFWPGRLRVLSTMISSSVEVSLILLFKNCQVTSDPA